MNQKTLAEPPTQRRRRPWLLVAIVAILGVLSNSWYFWPLNSMERRLIGDWSGRTEVDTSVAFLTLKPGRSFTLGISHDGGPLQVIARGKWQADDTGLFVYPTRSFKDKLVLLLRQKTIDVSWDLHLPKVGAAESELTLKSPWGPTFQRQK